MDAETTIGNLLLEAGHGEEAVVHYQNALRLEPSALAHYNLAVGFHRIGRLWEAIVHYKEALRIQPDYPDADYFLGQALLENGQTDEAKEHSDKH
jgi:tetratricopeptide (TPR) repeat protein